MKWSAIKFLRRLALGLMCVLFSAGVVMAGGDKGSGAERDNMVLIPTGAFVMGSDKLPNKDESAGVGTIKPWYLDEHPAHKVELKAYLIDRYEITDAKYEKFVAATGHTPPIIWGEDGYLLSLRMDELSQLDSERGRRWAGMMGRLDRVTRTMYKKALLSAIVELLQ